jgi:hypothetical protein
MSKFQFSLRQMFSTVAFTAAVAWGAIGAMNESRLGQGIPTLLYASLAITATAGLVGLIRGGHLGHWLAGGFIASWPLSWWYLMMRMSLLHD